MKIKIRPDHLWLLLALIVAALHGLVYIFLLPPWQHYDEPKHFEAVGLAAGLEGTKPEGDYNPKLSRQVYRSMLLNGFFDYTGSTPNMPPRGVKIILPGFTQLDEPPLYYQLAAVPVRLLADAGINARLYAARGVSLGLYLLTVLAGWGVACSLFAPGHLMRRLLPLTLALLPGVMEWATAVNNDALALALFSLCFWGCARLIVRGLNLLDLAWVLAWAALTPFAKNTALVALLLLPPTLLFSLLRGRGRQLAWGLMLLSLIAAPLLALQPGEATAWYRGTSQTMNTRTIGSGAPHGEAWLQLDGEARTVPIWSHPLYQIIPPGWSQRAFGQRVTVGAWMWAGPAEQAAAEGVSADGPRLLAAGETFSHSLSLSAAPQFYAFHATLGRGSDRIWLILEPRPRPQAVQVYYDGLVLAAGDYPLDQPPSFDDSSGLSGQWGGQAFTNLLRNPSAESSALRVRPWLDERLAAVLPDRARPTVILASLHDISATRSFYQITLRHLFQTAWARFGWGHVPLLGAAAYPLLALASLLALIGLALGLLRLGRRAPGALLAVGALALAAAWGLTLVRGAVYLSESYYYYPPARHALPSLLPLVSGLVFGWLELGRQAGGRLAGGWLALSGSTGRRVGLALYIGSFILLDLWSWFSIATYYATH